MMPWLVRATLLAVTVATPAALAAQARVCFRYEPQEVQLRGRLELRSFPGPPNYADTTTGDRPEEAAILRLDDPVCVSPDGAALAVEPELDIREVQLVLSPDAWQAFNRLRSRPVVVTGTLSHAISGHHRTRVLMTVARLSPAVPSSSRLRLGK